MSQPPVIDDRTQAEIFQTLVERADAYTDRWDPQTPDNGRTLLRVFSSFESDVQKRLNEVPEKQQIAFLDALGFDRRPPQAARAPLTFDVSTDLDRNVVIPGGTQAVANIGGGDSKLFELPQNGGFEATGASVTDVIAVDPSTDRILEHSDILDSTDRTTLFTGANLQQHVLYMGHTDSLNLAANSMFTVVAETPLEECHIFECARWEYYGEGPDGDEQWHQLETPSDEYAEDEVGVEGLQQRLESRSQSASPLEGATGDDHVVEQMFLLPGQPVVTTVNGVESRWIRCVLERESAQTAVNSLAVHVSNAEMDSGLEPDLLLANDVPLSAEDGDILPFGRIPHPPATFYVACQEAFTKPGGAIELVFEPPTALPDEDNKESESTAGANPDIGILGGPPEISWEYWNGEGWTRLGSVTDETDVLRTVGTVQFTVPDDLEATTVSGHENVWIRARLVSGNYGQPAFAVGDDGAGGSLVDQPDAPQFGDVTVRYQCGRRSFENIVSQNNASFSDDLTQKTEAFTPFMGLEAKKQALYLGFDEPLRDGPLTLFIPVEDAIYPRTFDPGIQWEYCQGSSAGWSKLDMQDRTGGLTERGIVTLTFPEPTTAVSLFGRERHWIRARVTKDEFDLWDQQSTQAESQSADASVPTDVSSERTTTPPVLEGLYPNTQWAYNTRTIEDEVLGSSDGSHDQTLRCAHAPVIDMTVWVDEQTTLSAGERQRLQVDRPEAVRPEYDSRGDLTAFWVRWETVENFLDSGPTDRHFVVNRTLGQVSFGDGDYGKIPVSGQDNIKATYTTGGGSDGNVRSKTITELKSSIALVDSVSNPIPADGGADIESTEALISRSTSRLKNRGRAVTARDYEQVAKATFPELRNVVCDPTLDGGAETSRVTVLIVPQTNREKPVPSMELKYRVRDVLYERAPASVVESETSDIVVRGPDYGELSVETTVRATAVKSVSLLKQSIEDRLDAFLHPLTGNDGSGWEFGELPTVDSLVDVVESVDSVSELLTFDVTIEYNNEVNSLSKDQVSLPRDTLVCSGQHEITVTVEGAYK